MSFSLRDPSFVYIVIALILFCSLLTGATIRRAKIEPGCFYTAYIILVIFFVSFFSMLLSCALYNYTTTKADHLINGKRYKAEVVDFQRVKRKDSDGYTYYAYYPVLEFWTVDGRKITQTSDEAQMSEKLRIGETQTVFYLEKTDTVTTLGASTLLTLFGLFIALVCFSTPCLALIAYNLGLKKDKIFSIGITFGRNFFFPFLLICFDLLLIYALFYGNTAQAWWSIPLLLFFILSVTVAIWYYLKSLWESASSNKKSEYKQR